MCGARGGWKGRSPATGSPLPPCQNISSRARNGAWERGLGRECESPSQLVPSVGSKQPFSIRMSHGQPNERAAVSARS
eukprot:4731102-Pyramimonas_sp.AAC.1